MRVLIVGGTRFIGAHVAQRLYELGADVTAFHRGQSENPILPPIRHIHDPCAEYPVTRFPASIRQEWDIVVHMVLMGEADARAAVELFDGRAGRIVMISIGDVYRAYGRLTRLESGPLESLPLNEDSPLRAVHFPYRGQEQRLGAYARDYEKILAERVLMEAASIHWTVLRLPKVYGREDNGDLATVYSFANQPQWRWTHGHVENVAAAIALASTDIRARNQVYNVGEVHTPTMGERLRKLPPTKRSWPSPPPFDYGQSIVYDTTRIRRGLDFKEPLDEGAAMAALVSG